MSSLENPKTSGELEENATQLPAKTNANIVDFATEFFIIHPSKLMSALDLDIARRSCQLHHRAAPVESALRAHCLRPPFSTLGDHLDLRKVGRNCMPVRHVDRS